MYFAGFIGLKTPEIQQIFKALTSFNLWVSLIILLVFHQNWSTRAAYIFLIIMLLGFFIEVLGVATGQIFGQYYYGATLGKKFLETPIAIAANWLILCYCCTYFAAKILGKNVDNFIVIALIASISMVLIDFLIEPVAIKLDFWSWQTVNIPVKNYIGWFFVSFVLNLILIKSKVLFENKIALLLLTLQTLFFICHNLN